MNQLPIILLYNIVKSSFLNLFILFSGHALSALGRKDNAFLVWKEGYGHAINKTADLKQLLELEELLASAGLDKINISEDHVQNVSGVMPTVSDTHSENYSESNGTHKIDTKPIGVSGICSKPIESNNKVSSGKTITIKGNSKIRSISLDFRLSRGIAKVPSSY